MLKFENIQFYTLSYSKSPYLRILYTPSQKTSGINQKNLYQIASSPTIGAGRSARKIAALARQRPRVQIPPGPLRFTPWTRAYVLLPSNIPPGCFYLQYGLSRKSEICSSRPANYINLRIQKDISSTASFFKRI